MSQSTVEGGEEGNVRPKLSLQKRSDTLQSAPSPTYSSKTSKPNPFGDARPREQVIAEREGKKEMEVLKEQASKEWKPQPVLTESQLEEKKAAEAELSFAKIELEKETNSEKLALLTEEVASKEKNLEQLLASFEKLAAQPLSSGGSRRSYDKNPSPMMYGGESTFVNFRSRAVRDGGVEKSNYSFGESWGGVKKGGGQSECYTCGEVGHFSRECQQGSSYGGGALGGGRGGGRACYTCGQSGHFSRDCPQGGSYGGGFSSYGGQPHPGNYGAGFSGYGGGQPHTGSYGGGFSGYGAGQSQGASYGGGFSGYGGGQLQADSYGSVHPKGYSYGGGFSGYNGSASGSHNANNNGVEYNGHGRR